MLSRAGGTDRGRVGQSDPSIDLDTLKLPPAVYAIAKAAQDYGFVIGDTSGLNVGVGVEDTVAEGRGWLWNGLLTNTSLDMFPLSDYEFVKLGYGA